MKPMVLGFGCFYRKLGDQGEMFSIFGYKEKDFKPLMRTFWVSKPAHEKLSGFFGNGCLCQSWLGWSLSWFRHSNSDINLAKDYLDLVEGVHTFRSDPFVLDLEVCNSTFKRLKVPTETTWWLKLWSWMTRNKML